MSSYQIPSAKCIFAILHITPFCVWNCSLFHLSYVRLTITLLYGSDVCIFCLSWLATSFSFIGQTHDYQNPRTLILKIPLSTSLTASWNRPLKMPFSIGPFESCWSTSSGSSELGSWFLAFSLTSALTWTKNKGNLILWCDQDIKIFSQPCLLCQSVSSSFCQDRYLWSAVEDSLPQKASLLPTWVGP